MKIGIWSDAHITKKHRENTEKFQDLVLKSFNNMYETFSKEKVSYVVNCGDFLDKPILDSSDAPFLNKILDLIQSYGINTYFLLGNHEAYKDQVSVLNLLEREYISVKSNPCDIPGSGLLLPYYTNIEEVKSSFCNRIVFTHHDIFGKNLSNLTGLDHNLFKEAKLVINGHVHQREKISENLYNIGSLFQQSFNDNTNPGYAILDTDTDKLRFFNNTFTFHFEKVTSLEDMSKLSNKDLTFVNCVGFESPDDNRFLKITNTPIMDINLENDNVIPVENKSVTEILKEYCNINKLSEKVFTKSLEVYNASIK